MSADRRAPQVKKPRNESEQSWKPVLDSVLTYRPSSISVRCSVSPAFEGLVSHWPYIAMLPEDILTPMQFSAVEVQLLEGTPLHSDALERRQDKLASFLRSMVWLRERRAASDDLVASTAISAALGPIGHESLSDLLSHQYQWGADTIRFPAFATWLWASTAYGSRSFPPKMVAQRAQPRHLVAPVLLPGIDAFNHARGVPVTWTSPCCPTKEPAKPAIPASGEAGASIEFEAAITIHSGVKAGEQVFNCYGGKSNEEFLAGYGFVVPGGPDDTLTLVLGGQVGPTSKQAPEPSGKSASHTDTADSSFSALTLRKPWGQRHYWTKPRDGISAAAAPAGLLIELRERLISGGQNDQGPSDSPPIELSWLLKPHTATPSLPSTPTEGGVGRNEDTGNQAKVAETVTSTLGKAALVARRKRRHQLEALHLDGEVLETLEELLCAKRKLFRSSQKTLESVLVEQNQAIIRPAVLRLVSVYREGQSMIFDQAVEWTRSKMDELVVLIEELETEVNN